MRNIEFYKLHASGNDFILLNAMREEFKRTNQFYRSFSRLYCHRKFGIGADGVLVIEPAVKADFTMRIFNADGSEAEMCGNGARCAAFWASKNLLSVNEMKFQTKAGVIAACVELIEGNDHYSRVKIKMSDPHDVKLGLPLQVLGRKIKVNFINTGVPHAVVFVQGLDSIEVEKIGRAIRFHKKFAPAGTNVNFVEQTSDNSISLRTYERGVEAETLACGTGTVASSILSVLTAPIEIRKQKYVVNAHVHSQEILKVSFTYERDIIKDVWLQGEAHMVYKGTIA